MAKNYDYCSNIWNYILPEGSSFCHWGGKSISRRVLELLDLEEGDQLCDLGCGEAGTLTLINQPGIKVYGIDISDSALKKAKEGLKRVRNSYLVQGDVRNMPFPSGFFNKLFTQDPDVFLHPQKNDIMKEISRVSKVRATFVCQTYCATSYLTVKEEKRTEEILRNLGYPYTTIMRMEDIFKMFTLAGFKIQFIENVHSIYEQDNLLMIKNLEKNWLKIKNLSIKELLEWEKYLFSKKAWTGVIIKAKKM